MITKDQYLESLYLAGLKKNDNVLVHSELSLFGKPDTKANKNAILDFYYNNIKDIIGEKGTIITPTFTGKHYVKLNLPFDIKNTQSELGGFSEYLRRKKKSIRSIHPIVSLCAIGENADYICGGNHFDGYSYDSPWGKLLNLNAKILTLGYGIHPNGMSVIHFLENLIGMPYLYNKLFKNEVYSGKKKINGIFTMSVRYLEYGIENDQSKFKALLVKEKKAKVIELGRGKIFSTTFKNVFEVGMNALAKDRYMLLKRNPNFKPNQKPLI